MGYFSDKRKCEAAWKKVSGYHPEIRRYQNKLVSELIKTKVELEPAEIKISNPIFHWFHGDYFGFSHRKTNTIMISSQYCTDWKELFEEYNENELPSFPEYILNRVANAEGTRTANHISREEIIFGRYEWEGMFYIGDWLGSKSVKSLGLTPIPLEESVTLAFKKRKTLAKALKSPRDANRYVSGIEQKLRC